VAVDTDPFGGSAVAYREVDTYYYENRLKVARDRNPLFVDGFESGNTSAWSVAVP